MGSRPLLGGPNGFSPSSFLLIIINHKYAEELIL